MAVTAHMIGVVSVGGSDQDFDTPLRISGLDEIPVLITSLSAMMDPDRLSLVTVTADDGEGVREIHDVYRLPGSPPATHIHRD